MPVLTLVSLRRLGAVDRSAAVPVRAIAILRSVSIFEFLPPPEIERLLPDYDSIRPLRRLVSLRDPDAAAGVRATRESAASHC